MYGAILGDVVGSRFEFDRGGKSKQFDMFSEDCTWTDDTVMTVAVAAALLRVGRDAPAEKIMRHVSRSMRLWGSRYPHAGYGARFYGWLNSSEPRPYGSYGNGSAMRVSSAEQQRTETLRQLWQWLCYACFIGRLAV